jgi:hypothetical protein
MIYDQHKIHLPLPRWLELHILGKVVFVNPENLTLDEVSKKLIDTFLPDQLFVASQISIPEEFLFLDGEFSKYDHCYHEFDCVEICEESPTDYLGRSVTVFFCAKLN